ncbi:hypothetical protein PR202_gb05378 [Eleusine coracana subsp. coracana]|uniref:Uncharacterized protein n=1 Tax=Eleusine coracana subsp. coracana TaxID=191504 RepID=A0AAV5E4C0_ELECO|nr:hypothetical protein PR202_gb05378 [Eleusine coracana subsp. coracana]
MCCPATQGDPGVFFGPAKSAIPIELSSPPNPNPSSGHTLNLPRGPGTSGARRGSLSFEGAGASASLSHLIHRHAATTCGSPAPLDFPRLHPLVLTLKPSPPPWSLGRAQEPRARHLALRHPRLRHGAIHHLLTALHGLRLRGPPPAAAGCRLLRFASRFGNRVLNAKSRRDEPEASRQILCKAEVNISSNLPESVPESSTSGATQYEKIVELLTTLFPVWVILGTIIGIYKPSMTLNLSAPLATGLVLVSCCPGGQASNVATYISKGNVALSVLMTTCSTIGAIVMTPLLTKILAGQLVPVDAVGLAMSTFQVVLMPTIVGVLANEYFPKFTKSISFLTPLIGVVLTTLLCASPIGQVADVLKAQGAQLIFPVALLHVAAFGIGYWLSRLCSFGESTSRTVSIECGMQSSALGFLLAQKHFTNPLVAVPSAVSVVCMALGGSALAVYWRNVGLPANDKDDFKE